MGWAANALSFANKYYQLVIAFGAVYSIHLIQLRNVLLADLHPLADYLFYLDSTSELIWSLIVAGMLTRVLFILLSTSFVRTPIIIFWEIFSVVGRLSSRTSLSGQAYVQEAMPRYFNFVNERSAIIQAILFAMTFYSVYCGFLLSIFWLFAFIVFLFVWICLSAEFVFEFNTKDFKINVENRIVDKDHLLGLLKERLVSSKTLLVGALSLSLISYFLATVRGHYLLSKSCVEVRMTDSRLYCSIVVAKSHDGIFAYYVDEPDTPVFIPFGAISEMRLVREEPLKDL